MTDKPKDKIEELLEQIVAQGVFACRQVRGVLSRYRKAAAACSVLIALLLLAGYVLPKEITVYETGLSSRQNGTVYKTAAKTVEDFLTVHGIDFELGVDGVSPGLDAPVKRGMELHITKAVDITLTADGSRQELKVLPVTVEELLAAQGIVLDGNDRVEPSLDTVLQAGDAVTVIRVVEMKEHHEVEEDYEILYEEDPDITIGDVQVKQKGRKGKIRETYSVVYENGVEVSRELSGTEVLKETRDKIYSYGTKIDISAPAGLKYEKKYENVRAVSYYFSGDPHGAYGLPCEFGTVAVDKDLIPLGSLLYIEGYGYAIANDVGTSIKGKTVDLYMEKYEQCLLWGARWTTVYVIDEA